MKKPRLPKIHYGVFLPFAALFLILMVIFPRNAKFSYDYRKGSPWTHETLIAQFDFPILKTDDQLREEKSANRPVEVPYYVYREDVVSNSMKAAEEAELGEYSSLRPVIVSSMMDTYSNGVVSDEGVKLDSRAKKDPDAILYIHKDKRVSKKPASEVLKESDAKAKLLDEVSKKAKGANADSILNASGIYNLIVPNLEYDPKTTELVNAQNDAQISPTQGFVSAGQLIVSKGEIVTAEVAQILDSYKVEYEANMGYGGPKVLFWLGNALIAALLVFLIFITLYFSNNSIFKEMNRFLYILFVFLLITVVTLAKQVRAEVHIHGAFHPDCAIPGGVLQEQGDNPAMLHLSAAAADLLQQWHSALCDVHGGQPGCHLHVQILQPQLDAVHIRPVRVHYDGADIFWLQDDRHGERQSLSGAVVPVHLIHAVSGWLSACVSVREDVQSGLKLSSEGALRHEQSSAEAAGASRSWNFPAFAAGYEYGRCCCQGH